MGLLKGTIKGSIKHIHKHTQSRKLRHLPARRHVHALGEGNGSSLQYSRLENPMDRGGSAGYSPRGRKELDTAERLTNREGGRHVHTYTQTQMHTLSHSSIKVSAEFFQFLTSLSQDSITILFGGKCQSSVASPQSFCIRQCSTF